MLALALLVCALALDEFFRMARGLRPIPLTGFAAGLAMVLATWHAEIGWSLAALAASIPVTFLVVAGVAPRESALGSVAVTTFGALYIGGGVASLVALRGLRRRATSSASTSCSRSCLGTWASDIFAYFGGRLLGRHRLAPAISPNKTVEGFVIGLAAGIFTTWVTLYREGFTNPQALLVGSAWRWPRRSATSSSRSSSATSASRTRGRCWPGTAASSTASTRCSSRGRRRSPSSPCSARAKEPTLATAQIGV